MRRIGDHGRVNADMDDSSTVTLSMAMAELVALREAIAFADFDGGLPGRSEAEVEVLSRFLRTADSLIPELGSDRYEQVLNAAWREIAPD